MSGCRNPCYRCEYRKPGCHALCRCYQLQKSRREEARNKKSEETMLDVYARENRTRSDVTNYNSVSIELCINSDSNKAAAYKNVLELTKNLMRKFNVPADRVVRHLDASGKPCPGSLQANKWAKWWQFKADIKKPVEWKIDLSKSSEFGPGKATEKAAEKKGEKAMAERDINKVSPWAEKEWQEATEAGITDGTRPGAVATREEVAAMILRGNKCKCNGEND